MMSDPIYFYGQNGSYACFSNFAPYAFELDGKYWPTVEHYFQAQKFADTEYELRVQRAYTPKDARTFGRRRDWPLRADWEDVKDEVMLQAVRRKFETHADIRQILLDTGDAQIVENSPFDYYWGCGKSGTGKNRLGEILMQVRAELQTVQPK